MNRNMNTSELKKKTYATLKIAKVLVNQCKPKLKKKYTSHNTVNFDQYTYKKVKDRLCVQFELKITYFIATYLSPASLWMMSQLIPP